jgi:hypothetical protein
VKDNWEESVFEGRDMGTVMGTVQMKLAQREILMDNSPLREMRKLSDNKHRIGILTTNRMISLMQVAAYMLGYRKIFSAI